MPTSWNYWTAGASPQSVWVTTDNVTNAGLRALVSAAWARAGELLRAGEPLVELGDRHGERVDAECDAGSLYDRWPPSSAAGTPVAERFGAETGRTALSERFDCRGSHHGAASESGDG